jgi:hypothetical protein
MNGLKMECKICGTKFGAGNDSVVLCNNKGGFAHLGCCCDLCSWNHKPCEHSMGVYSKL